MMNKTTFLKSLLPALLASLSISFVHGQGADHPLIDRFPDSRISDLEFEPDSNYRLILGSLARTRGVVVPGESERLRGDVTRIIYEISEEFNGEDVYQYFQEQIQDKGYDVLFSCTGRDCGSSVYWANDIFQNRVLYGPERNQYYSPCAPLPRWAIRRIWCSISSPAGIGSSLRTWKSYRRLEPHHRWSY